MLSFLKRKDSPAPANAADEAVSVQAARTRARRRLIGAAVLVGIGIIGFPLLFETQPRPIAVDIPIEIPARDRVPPLKPPAGKAAVAPRASGPVVPEATAEAPSAPVQTAAVPAAVPPATPPATPAAPSAPAPRAERSASAPATVARSAASATESSRDAQRAQALLEGKSVVAATEPSAAAAPEPKAPRFVVQAGAYTDASSLREARQKVEKLGLKTYTQVIETDNGSRTRVRVGPFDSREEAEKVAARIKGSGLAASILSL